MALTISIVVAIAVIIGVMSQVWTEVLWFNQLSYVRVLLTQWIAAAILFLVGFAVMFGAVFVSMTAAYRAREIGMPDDEATRNLEAYRTVIEPLRRRMTWVVPAVLAVLGSGGALAPSWREVLLAFNSQSFGVKDPQFGIDISFYVFVLPAVLTLVSFLSSVVLFSGVASVVVHYLYGGISVVRKPHFTKAARTHVAIFLALYAVIRAAGYWLDATAPCTPPTPSSTAPTTQTSTRSSPPMRSSPRSGSPSRSFSSPRCVSAPGVCRSSAWSS